MNRCSIAKCDHEVHAKGLCKMHRLRLRRWGEVRADLPPQRTSKTSRPLRQRERKLRQLYGMTLADYASMLRAQGNQCALCRTENPGSHANNFFVDHCHQTGRVRGLLCLMCNRNIVGMIEALGIDPRKIVAYLGTIKK